MESAKPVFDDTVFAVFDNAIRKHNPLLLPPALARMLGIQIGTIKTVFNYILFKKPEHLTQVGNKYCEM